MTRFLILLFAFISISATIHLGISLIKDYPQDYFRSPVDHAIKLSGTFGELRPNHFHAGIDIKSKTGKTGQDLFAVADGTVSRINIKSSGYGNALYIDHPNGYTSVYAHLGKFPKEIADYMQKQQYSDKTSEIEHYPPAGQFNFEKGDFIGTLGLSGRSYGPHLHFEIRDTESEVPINPLLFGLKINDTVGPSLRSVKVYGLDANLHELDAEQYSLRKSGSKYKTKKDTILVNTDQVGLALKAYDQMTGVSNLNGIYALKMYVEDSLHFAFAMDEISFDETRYINAHMDYPEREQKKSYYNRCFRLPGNQLSIYEANEYNGVINVTSKKAIEVKYIVTDLNDNVSELTLWLKKSQQEMEFDRETYQYLLFHDKENQIDRVDLKLFFPKGSLYRNLEMQFLVSTDSSYNIFSNVYHLHDYLTPLHKYFDIAIKPNVELGQLKEKAFIGYCGDSQKYTNCGGTWEGEMLATKTSQLGNFCIMLDTIPPRIQPVRFSKNWSSLSSVSFKIDDNFDVGKGGKGLSYEAYLDDQWILMSYNGKTETITYRFDEYLQPGEHVFKLLVTDGLGNTSSLVENIKL